jgi:predicted transcriptional regulator with HTH domain
MTMSQLITHILDRLAEIFPSQDYASRLERYVNSKNPCCAEDIERLEREFTYNAQKNL